MLDLSTAINDHLQSRGPRHAHLLVWIEARNRDTQAAEEIGFWTGADHQDFTTGGQTQTYYGAGGLLKMSPLTIEAGLKVRTQRLTFSKVAPEVQLAVRGYDTYKARIRIYVAYFDVRTRALIDEPVRRFKGRVAGLTMPREKREAGDKQPGFAKLELSVRSAAEELTQGLPVKKSDEALQERAPGDRGRRYIDVSGAAETVWGEIRAKAPEGAAEGNKDATPPRESPNR